MDAKDTEWKVDELKTASAMLHICIMSLSRLTKLDRGQFVTRAEYLHIINRIISCLERQCDESERMISCLETLTNSVEKLTAAVVDLQKRYYDEP